MRVATFYIDRMHHGDPEHNVHGQLGDYMAVVVNDPELRRPDSQRAALS
jgi:hypothetical protein